MTEHHHEDHGGITLPPIGSAVAKVANSAPGKALLLPATKVWGEYFGWLSTEVTEGWKKQREERLKMHAEKVRKKEGIENPRDPTEKQVILVNEWIERAQEVDPNDPEIAALWQSLLGAIYRKETTVKEQFEVIKQLNESDARLLLRMPEEFEPENSREQGQAVKFESLGLLEGFHWTRALKRLLGDAPTKEASLVGAFYSAIRLLSLLTFTFLVSAVFIVPDQVAKMLGSQWSWLIRPTLGVALFMSAVSLGLFLLHWIGLYRITGLGRVIRNSALLYLEKRPGVRETKVEGDAANPAKSQSATAPQQKKSKRGRQK
jgi:hypothetical protein